MTNRKEGTYKISQNSVKSKEIGPKRYIGDLQEFDEHTLRDHRLGTKMKKNEEHNDKNHKNKIRIPEDKWMIRASIPNSNLRFNYTNLKFVDLDNKPRRGTTMRK
jgi:hypothetical protein